MIDTRLIHMLGDLDAALASCREAARVLAEIIMEPIAEVHDAIDAAQADAHLRMAVTAIASARTEIAAMADMGCYSGRCRRPLGHEGGHA